MQWSRKGRITVKWSFVLVRLQQTRFSQSVTDKNQIRCREKHQLINTHCTQSVKFSLWILSCLSAACYALCHCLLSAVKAAKYQRQMTLLICDLHDLYNITNNGTALIVNVTKYFMISGQWQAYHFGWFYEFFKQNKLHNTYCAEDTVQDFC